TASAFFITTRTARSSGPGITGGSVRARAKPRTNELLTFARALSRTRRGAPMTPEELPAIRTPVTAEELALAFCAAFRAITLRTPSRDTIVLLLAHSSLETAHWKSMMCWNIGNIKSRAGDGRCWCYFRCSAIINGKEVFFD